MLAIITVLIIVSWPIYVRQPVMNEGIKEAMEFINSQEKDCVIGDWGKGHIYQYYTHKDVLYKGSPRQIREQIDYMVHGKLNDCMIIFTQRDILALEYAMSILQDPTLKEDWSIFNRRVKHTATYKDQHYWVI